MSKKIEPLSRKWIERMVANGVLGWRRPLPLIPRRWGWALIAGAVALAVAGVIAFPSL